MNNNEGVGSTRKAKTGILKSTIVFVLAEPLFFYYLIQIFFGNITNLPVLHQFFFHYFSFMFYEPNGTIGRSTNWVPFEFDAFYASLAGWQTVMFQRVVWLITAAIVILSITTLAIYLARFHKLKGRNDATETAPCKNTYSSKKMKRLIPLIAGGAVVAFYWAEILVGNITSLPGFNYIFDTYFRQYLEGISTFPIDGFMNVTAQENHLVVHFIFATFNVFSAGLALIGVAVYVLLKKKTNYLPETISSPRPDIR